MGTTSRISPRSENDDPLVSMDEEDDNKNHSPTRESALIRRLASTSGVVRMNEGMLHPWSCRHRHCRHWTVLALGQLLSFLLACAGAAQATLHLNCNLSAPTFASGLIYFALSFFLIPVYWRRRTQRSSSLGSTILENHHQNDDNQGITHTKGEYKSKDDEVVVVEDATSFQPRPTRYSFLFGRIPLHSPAWAYFCIALLDVEANYLTVLAFRFTTLTSVSLFDALAIPSAMVLSKLFLKRTYKRVHLMGAVVCMTGIVANVLTDYESDKDGTNDNDDDLVELENKEYPHRILGDVLAITGGLLYGANNVLQESVVKGDGGPMEFLAMLGLFGTCISAVQVLILERHDVAEFLSRSSNEDDSDNSCGIATGIFLLLAYVTSLVFGYVGGSYFLVVSEAALLNLSLLTGDLWSVTFSIVAERIVPSPLFFVALVLIVSGVLLYETGPSPMNRSTDDVEEDIGDDSLTLSEHGEGSMDNGATKNGKSPWRYDEVEMTPDMT